MQALLSYEKAPPLAAPLRFFLTGPLFAVLAGLLLFIDGPALFASRWQPATLAATHLITLGFMLQIMLGALIQILPVVAGVNLARPLAVATVTHLGLTLGTLWLGASFYFVWPNGLLLSAAILASTVAAFLVLAGRPLFGVPSTSPTIRGLKLAFAGLAGVVGLGVLLAVALARGLPLSLPLLTDLHAAWGLGAWSGVLLAAMAYVVVPMFQLTPGYPARPSWWFPVVMLGLVLLWSAAAFASLPAELLRLAQGLLALTGAAFAALTLHLQNRRRRARSDATYRYWQLGLGAVILALAMLLTAAIWPPLADIDGWTLLFGLLLLGAFQSFIIGMLYKIVPFLCWLHLQNCGQARVAAPAMNKLLPDLAMQRQLKAQAAAFALLLAAVFFPDWLARPAGLAFALANGWLLVNLLGARRRYRRHAVEIANKLAAL